VADQYDNYRARLLGEKLALHENKPEAGAYRRQNQNREWEAVMLWQDGGVWKARVTGPEADYNITEAKDGFEAICRLWSSCCRNLVAFAIYHSVVEKKQPWPDEIVRGDRSNSANVPEIDRLKDEIDQLVADAKKLLDKDLLEGFDAAAYAARLAANLDTSDLTPNLTLLSNYATKLVELRNESDGKREVEKAPFLKGGRDVDDKWRDQIKKAENNSRDLKQKVGKALAEIKAKVLALAPPKPPAGEQPARAADVKVNAGSRGKRVALRTERFVAIDDYDKALEHALKSKAFRELETMRKMVTAMAEYELVGGREFPGARFDTREVAA
jgi:hypothetical protein